MVDFADILSHPYWRHRIDLGNGKFTPGTKDISHWDALGLPKDLSGKTFLDIGAFDGLHSFEAERRGAEDILATDVWGNPDYDTDWWNNLRPGKKGFNLVHKYLNSDVRSKTIAVEDISPDAVGKFDIVLCSGVIYHVKEPLRAIENIVSVAEEMVVIESAISENLNKLGMEFYPRSERGHNPSNWWAPTLSCLEEMAKITGCEEVKGFYPPIRISDTETPEIEFGATSEKCSIYRDPGLENEVDILTQGLVVKCLYETGENLRVECRKDTSGRIQGWVSKKSIDKPLDSFHKRIKQAEAVYNRDGWKEVLNQSLSILKKKVFNKKTRGVIHGYI